MLCEEKAKIDWNSVRRCHFVPNKADTQREKTFLRLVSDGLIVSENEHKIDGIESLLSLYPGTDLVISDPDHIFSKMLYKEKWNGEEGFYGKHRLTRSCRDGMYFITRYGKLWGSLFLWNDDISCDQLRDKYNGLLDECKKADWNITKLLPSQKMTERLMRDKIREMPIISRDLSKRVIEMSQSCFKGGRMEACQLGSYLQVFDYDMNSAYLSALIDLPSLSEDCIRWVDSKDYVRDSFFGFCYCRVYPDKELTIGPVALRLSMNHFSRLYYPVDCFEAWLTKDEIDLLDWASIDYEIIDGVWGILRSDYTRVFLPVVNVLSKLIENPISHQMGKHMSSVSWGKFASKYSLMWNPVYSSYITAKIRSMITRIAMCVGDSLVAITIDGIVSTKSLSNDNLSGEIGKLKTRNLSGVMSLTDFYRYSKEDNRSWFVKDEFVEIMIDNDMVKVPFGSTKRRNPKCKLTLKTLRENVFKLSPPSPEECIELFLTSREIYSGDIDG